MRSRVLLIQQELGTIAITARLLHRLGYEIVASASAAEAFSLLQKDPDIECAVVDVNLPGVGLAEIVAWLRSIRPSIHIVVATGEWPARIPPGVFPIARPYTLSQLNETLGQACSAVAEWEDGKSGKSGMIGRTGRSGWEGA